jgi:hypothetical protein
MGTVSLKRAAAKVSGGDAECGEYKESLTPLGGAEVVCDWLAFPDTERGLEVFLECLGVSPLESFRQSEVEWSSNEGWARVEESGWWSCFYWRWKIKPKSAAN